MAETPDALTLDRVRGALAGGPLSLADLCARLGVDLEDADATGLWDMISDPHIVTLGDRRVADGAALAAGHRSLHRLDEDEVASRAMRLDEDVAGQVATATDPTLVTVGEQRTSLHPALDADGEEDPSADPLVDLPDGWRPELAAGDVVAVSVGGDGGLHITSDGVDVAAPGEDGGAAALVAALGSLGAALGTPLVGDGHPWVLDLVDALVQLLADAPDVVDGLRRPLTEVLDEAGMTHGGGFLASPGVEDHRLRLFQVGADILGGPWVDPDVLDQAEALGTVWLLLLGAGDDEIPERARALAVAAALADPEAPIALARHLRASGADVEDLLDRLAAASAVAPDAPGAAQLWAEAAVLAGRPTTVLDPLAAALADVDDEEWAEALELLGHLRAVAGDLDGASRVLTRIGLLDTVTFLGRWRSTDPADVGRNAPCPCGSGRKFKQCHLGRPAAVGLADRVELLWWKARTWCLRTQGLQLPWASQLDDAEDGDADALVLDLALVADDALAAFTVELGPLLPADEAELVEAWLERPHRLWEVGEAEADGAVALTDLTGPTDGASVTTVRPPVPALPTGETVLAVVVPSGEDHDEVVGQSVRVPPSVRDDAVRLLADHPTGQALLEWVLDLGPDAFVRPARPGPPSGRGAGPGATWG